MACQYITMVLLMLLLGTVQGATSKPKDAAKKTPETKFNFALSPHGFEEVANFTMARGTQVPGFVNHSTPYRWILWV